MKGGEGARRGTAEPQNGVEGQGRQEGPKGELQKEGSGLSAGPGVRVQDGAGV